MLKLLSFLTYLTIINAHYISQQDATVAIADCKLPRQEHLNLEGLKKIKKENVEEVALKDCNGVIDDKTFTELPNLASLYIQDSNIEEINTVLSIKKLEVRNSSFPNLDEGLQQKLPNLTNLELRSNKAFQVDPNILKNFKNLTELLIMQANFIEDCVTNEWFKGLDLLQKLVLGDNNISCISEDAFNSLKNLKTLRIGYNNFTTFKKLTTLKFHGNDTENIDLNIFASQKNHLEQLSIHWNVLTQNKITAEELLKAFPKLNELVVWRTKMTNNFKAKEFCQIVRQNGASCATPVLPGGMV